MSAQIIRDQNFPAPCKRCGEVLDRYVHFCPHCGMDRPLDTLAHTRPKAALRALGPTAAAPPVPEAAKLPANAEPSSGRPQVQPDYLQHSPFPHPGGWLFTKGFLLGAAILAIAFVAYLLLGESGHKQESTAADQSGRAADGPSAAAPARPRTDAMVPAAGTGPSAPVPGGQQRDNALQNAEQCAAQRDWRCVREQASAALAIDPSSGQAQTLMQRAILSTGWTPLATPPRPPLGPPPGSSNNAEEAVAAVPLPRGGSIVQLPSSRDWSATAPAVSKRISAPPLPLPVAATATPVVDGATSGSAATTATSTATERTATTEPAEPITAATPNPTNLDSPNATANTNAAAAAPRAASPARDGGDDDVATAQQRAILQSGWSHAVPSSDAAH